MITAWLSDDGGGGGQHHHGHEAPVRDHAEEGIVDGRRVGEQQRALPEVIEHQRGQHHDQPGRLDGPPAEMPEVGIERLGAGDGEEDRAQHDEPDEAVMLEEVNRLERIEGHQHRGLVEDVAKPDRRPAPRTRPA